MSAASTAWPHFVPRLEHEAHLKAVTDQLQVLSARLDRAEARGAEADQQIQGLGVRCIEDLATKGELKCAELRLDSSVNGCRHDLQVELEELREHAAADADLEQLKHDHGERIEHLEHYTSNLQQNIRDLELALKQEQVFCQATYETQLGHRETCDRLRHEWGDKLRALQDRITHLTADKADKVHVDSKHEVLTSKHNAHEQALHDAHHRLEHVAGVLTGVERRCNEELATRGAVEKVVQMVADLSSRIEEAVTTQLDLQRELHNERGALRTFIHSCRERDQTVKSGLNQVQRLDVARADLAERCGRFVKDLATVDGREQDHFQKIRAEVAEHKQTYSRALSDIETRFMRLQQQLAHH